MARNNLLKKILITGACLCAFASSGMAINLVSPEYNPSSASQPDARCKKSELTQEKFLEMLHAIIAHGDLTDKEFIEKTLGVKFGSASKIFAQTHTPNGGFYSSVMPNVPKAPIQVGLDIGSLSAGKDGKLGVSEILIFDHLNMVGAVFRNCHYLSGEQIEHKFGGNFHNDLGGYSKNLNLEKDGKNDVNIKISYSFMVNSEAINEIIISQQSNSHSSE